MEILLDAINYNNDTTDYCNYDFCLSDCYDCMCDSHYGSPNKGDDEGKKMEILIQGKFVERTQNCDNYCKECYDCKEDECGNDCSDCGCDTQEDGCPEFHGYDDCPMGA